MQQRRAVGNLGFQVREIVSNTRRLTKWSKNKEQRVGMGSKCSDKSNNGGLGRFRPLEGCAKDTHLGQHDKHPHNSWMTYNTLSIRIWMIDR